MLARPVVCFCELHGQPVSHFIQCWCIQWRGVSIDSCNEVRDGNRTTEGKARHRGSDVRQLSALSGKALAAGISR